MADKPIIFSAPMVRALLNDSKTQTRRIIKPQPLSVVGHKSVPFNGTPEALKSLLLQSGKGCPYGQPRDRLWVRETIRFDSECGHYYAATMPGSLGNPQGRAYVDMEKELSGKELPDHSIPGIHMPRWASRIELCITHVRVERLKSISEDDAIAEGIERHQKAAHWKNYDKDPQGWGYWESPIQSYRTLWNSINGPDAWDANPWVWVVEFERANHEHP
jgi:hypothetical protein